MSEKVKRSPRDAQLRRIAVRAVLLIAFMAAFAWAAWHLPAGRNPSVRVVLTEK